MGVDVSIWIRTVLSGDNETSLMKLTESGTKHRHMPIENRFGRLCLHGGFKVKQMVALSDNSVVQDGRQICKNSPPA